MSEFYEWLTGQQHDDENIRDLAKLAKDKADTWNAVSTEAEAKKGVEEDTTLPAADKLKYEAAVTNAWAQFSKGAGQHVPDTFRQRMTLHAVQNAPVYVIGGLALATVSILVFAIVDNDFLTRLANRDVARGLITFFFALGTVAVAIILVAAAFTSDGQGLKERFDMGKQVLTALIGIFGTIVGFYFGAEVAGQPESQGSEVPSEQVELARNTESAAESDATAEAASEAEAQAESAPAQ